MTGNCLFLIRVLGEVDWLECRHTGAQEGYSAARQRRQRSWAGAGKRLVLVCSTSRAVQSRPSAQPRTGRGKGVERETGEGRFLPSFPSPPEAPRPGILQCGIRLTLF